MKGQRIQLGQRWGQLEVLAKAESTPSGQPRWLCRCDCGRETVVIASNLKHGRTASCGCKRERDLTGQHIGRLTVLERSDRFGSRGKQQVRLWKCLCDCGAITYKATDSLTNKSVSMCKECAEKYAMTRARAGAGYAHGTQISKLSPVSNASQNTTGVRGVYLDRRTGRYRARIKFQGKTYNLGYYATLDEAIAARREGEAHYFETFLESNGMLQG